MHVNKTFNIDVKLCLTWIFILLFNKKQRAKMAESSCRMLAERHSSLSDILEEARHSDSHCLHIYYYYVY